MTGFATFRDASGVGQQVAAASVPVVLASDSYTQGQTTPQAVPGAAQNVLPLVKYNATPPALSDLQVVSLQADSAGLLKTRDGYSPVAEDNTNGVIAVARLPLAVPAYAWSNAFNAQVATNLIVKATPGVVRRVQGYLDLAIGAGTFYVLCLNEISAVNGTRQLLRAPQKIVVPVVPVDMPFDLDFDEGVYASTGITICVSTTAGNAATTANVTLAGAQMIVTSARYK